jgi:hypothetical protein
MYMVPARVELAELRRQHAKTFQNITTLEMLGREWGDTRPRSEGSRGTTGSNNGAHRISYALDRITK